MSLQRTYRAVTASRESHPHSVGWQAFSVLCVSRSIVITLKCYHAHMLSRSYVITLICYHAHLDANNGRKQIGVMPQAETIGAVT